MKKLFLLCLTTIIILLSQTESKAQSSYKNAIGVRLGAYNGLNYKTFISAANALDFNLSFRSFKGDNKLFRLTGLYEIHNPIANAAGLKWYYGAGASIGSRRYYKNDENDLYLAVVGVLGLDYKFAEAPINVALDWRPEFELTPFTDINEGDVGLAVRFTF